MITGMMPYSPDSYPQPFTYTAPTPKARKWVNREDRVWCLTIEYRKQSQGDAGVLGTYRTYQKAKAALRAYVEENMGEAAIEEHGDYLTEGAFYGCDETVEIVERDLE